MLRFGSCENRFADQSGDGAAEIRENARAAAANKSPSTPETRGIPVATHTRAKVHASRSPPYTRNNCCFHKVSVSPVFFFFLLADRPETHFAIRLLLNNSYGSTFRGHVRERNSPDAIGVMKLPATGDAAAVLAFLVARSEARARPTE